MKKILIFALTFALAVCIAGCTNKDETTAEIPLANGAAAPTSSDAITEGSAASSSKSENVTTPPSADEYIAPNMALKIAVAHAGVYEIFDEEVELDYERGKAVYEVSFESDKTEYEYEIDATNGDVLRFESEKDD